ncbi:hypothetical protein GYH30_023587 [Glycine max]|uniref:Uncharacterized protein n=1 Tax=Glycine max TaxID=3847 RepID=A0A0R0I1G2_SOYBN|nr:hypothetical protein GYH30_023587 [Glycine max]
MQGYNLPKAIHSLKTLKKACKTGKFRMSNPHFSIQSFLMVINLDNTDCYINFQLIFAYGIKGTTLVQPSISIPIHETNLQQKNVVKLISLP